ncbi:MAG: polysulfide reductase NrfD [Candidatus Marinimicrobia bacterium]|jgi:Fe-S-cluster-containing dehydrogenase component|nr:polysulfide reductase NrfD [Candidatus Neomarinimicrobiota bacterium]
MNYGFVIDNRMCIGCHACTVACKSEHDVPIGVNRTHVKYIEKGDFPNNTREFSVHRCNHCADAPCVEICPTMALHTRADGIVDFDNDRCIGCKSCMQACPYDALYIDPNTNTAAKCNYCAHKVDYGYEPACVVVCPVEAIVSGDLDDANSKIAQLVANEDTMTRKPEKMTDPNLYYVNGSKEMLDPNATEKDGKYLWSEQSTGVGHFAKYADQKLAESDTGNLLVQLAMENSVNTGKPIDKRAIDNVAQEIQQEVDSANARRVYDSPSKGVLWGWEVPAYVWTKAIATGTFLMMAIWELLGGNLSQTTELTGLMTTLVFMGLTGAFLVKDLDRPDRFLYVLLRPQWKSWLVRGAYIITVFGGIVTLKLIDNYFSLGWDWLWYLGAVFAVLGAVYTAFLFGQARSRDLWQSTGLSAVHMLIHAVMAGTVSLMFISPELIPFMANTLLLAIVANIIIIAKEVLLPHDTPDTKKAIYLMTKGYYSKYFWVGVFIGSIAPIVMINAYPSMALVAGGCTLIGIFLTEFVRIRVPQMIPLS